MAETVASEGPTQGSAEEPTPGSAPAREDPPTALRFITINEAGNSFDLNTEVVDTVLKKVPPEMKVCVVCVVGAFRTGKSFLLDLFLRYLRSTSTVSEEDTPAAEGEEPWKKWVFSSGNVLEGFAGSQCSRGFSWRPGNERNTTGIWIWSEPFIRRRSRASLSEDGNPSGAAEDVAVLLVDTQGLFDMKTPQMLTACIFGFSTLISSYLIYNIDKRIQEDNLQHLALFTEYARIALKADGNNSGGPSGSAAGVGRRPFQTLDLVVRDWQNYEDVADVDKCMSEMDPYLDQVLHQQSEAHRDLREVREHIDLCFHTSRVFLLPHPGMAVTRRAYSGALSDVDACFLGLLHREVLRVFGSNCARPTPEHAAQEQGALAPKAVNGREITASELLQFIKAYAKVFHDAVEQHSSGGVGFPEARTLLAATAEANNHNARDAAFRVYRLDMDAVCGSLRPYVDPTKIQVAHEATLAKALTQFDRTATMGNKGDIQEFREKLELMIVEKLEELLQNNEHKRPDVLRFTGILVMIGFAVYLTSAAASVVCWPPETSVFDFEYGDVCTAYLSALRDLYLTIFFFIALVVSTSGYAQLSPAVLTAVRAVAGISSGGKAPPPPPSKKLE
eukprot:RCo018662